MAHVGRLTLYGKKFYRHTARLYFLFNLASPHIPGGYQLAVESVVTSDSTNALVCESSGIYSE